MTRIRLPVDLIEPGMRIVKLDRPWTELPVLFQGFTVETDEQTRLLRHYCQWVLVEGERGQLALAQGKMSLLNHKIGKPMAEAHSLADELPRAHAAYYQGQIFVDQVLDAIERNDAVSLADARPVIQDCVKSITANANAMFWMTRIKSDDAYTAEHCMRVAVYAIAFGRFIGLPSDDLEVVGLCGMLHDIGKLKISHAILNKPGELTPAEMEEMRRHSELGFELLQSQHTLEPIVADVSRHHHERIDGKGYPQQLEEWQISRYARLISIVDAFDAITSNRCYRKGLSASDALRILYRGRGEQFDAAMIESFIRMVGIYPPGTLLELSSGEVALVLASHPGKKLKPKIEIVLDANKRPCVPVIIDLADDPLDADNQLYGINQPLPDGAHGVSVSERMNQIMDIGHTLTSER
ncbi:HD-GYP domain-containing protein [Marinobacter caseinilyticus]|uniref:HD-GYP domain-containing protein n=1 Tax=Marinobacter caseinilyticus TaxID=2692195 RepID=UPI001F30E10C|nr:HD-GYP domain-containing protein [Marinobacter caseinilyticus]